MSQSSKDSNQAKMQVIDINKCFSEILCEQTTATPNALGIDRNHTKSRRDRTRRRFDGNQLRAHEVDHDTLDGMKPKKTNNYFSPSDITTERSSLLAEPTAKTTRAVWSEPTSPSSYAPPGPIGDFQVDLTDGLQGIGSQFHDSNNQIVSFEEMRVHIEKSTTGTLETSSLMVMKTESGVHIVLEFGSG